MAWGMQSCKGMQRNAKRTQQSRYELRRFYVHCTHCAIIMDSLCNVSFWGFAFLSEYKQRACVKTVQIHLQLLRTNEAPAIIAPKPIITRKSNFLQHLHGNSANFLRSPLMGKDLICTAKRTRKNAQTYAKKQLKVPETKPIETHRMNDNAFAASQVPLLKTSWNLLLMNLPGKLFISQPSKKCVWKLRFTEVSLQKIDTPPEKAVHAQLGKNLNLLVIIHFQHMKQGVTCVNACCNKSIALQCLKSLQWKANAAQSD